MRYRGRLWLSVARNPGVRGKGVTWNTSASVLLRDRARMYSSGPCQPYLGSRWFRFSTRNLVRRASPESADHTNFLTVTTLVGWPAAAGSAGISAMTYRSATRNCGRDRTVGCVV